MAETEKNNLGAVQGNLTAADNARKKRDDLYKKGYSSHPDKAKRDEYAAVGEEIDANYNTAFAELRRLEEETRNQPIKFRSLTDADKERAQTVKDIKAQIPLQTRVAQELLPKGWGRSSKIAPLQGEASVQGESPTKQVDPVKEETSTISVRKPNESGFLYRVMYAGKGEEESRVFGSQREADEALKNADGKGAIARIALGYKSSGKKGVLGEPLPAEEQAERKKAYLDTFYKAKADKTMSDIRYKQNLERIKSPEFKAAVQERSKQANEAKRKRDYDAGAGFRSFKANNQARRESVGVLNDYNSQLGLLRSAYNQARQSKQFLTALKIQRSIQRYQEGVPKEMGERQKFAESGLLKERNDMLAKKLQEAEEAEEEARKKRKLAAANSDSGDY